MKVLLTGASGFLGRYVLKSLQQHGIDTIILGRQSIAGAGFIEADLLTATNLAALVKESAASHLLHLAWYAEHSKYWTSPLNLRWVEATTSLVEAFCEAGGQRVVVAGSCAEYDWSHGYCREASTPLNPTTLYGTSKDAARRLVMTVCAQHQVPCAWGRVFLPFGTGENRQRLVPSLIDTFLDQRLPFEVNAAAYRDFLHASDVAEAFIALLQSGMHETYNISSGQPVQLENLLRELARLLNANPQTLLELAAPCSDEPLLLVGENRKLKALGWQPALSFAQGLELTVDEALQ